MPIMTTEFRSLAHHLHAQGRIDDAKLARFERSLRHEERAWMALFVALVLALTASIAHTLHVFGT